MVMSIRDRAMEWVNRWEWLKAGERRWAQEQMVAFDEDRNRAIDELEFSRRLIVETKERLLKRFRDGDAVALTIVDWFGFETEGKQ